MFTKLKKQAIAQKSQFQKSVVVVPAKAGHEVKRNTIQYFQFFSGHRLSPV
jgi:hypothetical protein